MRRFLIINTLIFLVILAIGNNIYTRQSNQVNNISKVEDKDIYVKINGEWEEFIIKGINLDAAKPGVFPSQNIVNKDEYLRWINYISEMGMNCIKVANLMSKEFYEAFYEFNENQERPIYLMQGIYFDEEYLKDGYDASSEVVEKNFQENIELIIDSVHGNPNNTDNEDINTRYKLDISKYVLGYSLGIEFAQSDIIYTELMNKEKMYIGKYLYTTEDASSFENYLAKLGDKLIKYEFDKYKKQSILAFIGNASYHINSIYDNPMGNSFEEVNIRREKDYIDIENIRFKGNLDSGIIASYTVYPSYSEIRDHKENMLYYFKTINEYHSIPTIIGEIGIPSSRIGSDFELDIDKNTYINEQQQGNALVSVLKSIKNANLGGSFIFEFQDSWHRSSTNTRDLIILDKSAYFNDANTYSQHFGLMAFDPGKNISTSYPDENINEWSEKDILSIGKISYNKYLDTKDNQIDISTIEDEDKLEDISLSIKTDEKYIYFKIQTQRNIDISTQTFYIDLDITKNSGSNISRRYNIISEDLMDFIIKIEGINNSNVLVHEYYNTNAFINDTKKNQIRPDLMNKTKDMDVFSKIFIEVRPKIYDKSLKRVVEAVEYESGKLNYGIGNPTSIDFNSASDFYINKNYIEIRIPWTLLNFMDPSTKQVQDDLYEKFNIKPMMINDIGIGLTMKEDNLQVARLVQKRYDLDGWTIPNYHERLKESYYIVKKYLTQ